MKSKVSGKYAVFDFRVEMISQLLGLSFTHYTNKRRLTLWTIQSVLLI
jgi:hypothetical protein